MRTATLGCVPVVVAVVGVVGGDADVVVAGGTGVSSSCAEEWPQPATARHAPKSAA
jgi:hypothetical protein